MNKVRIREVLMAIAIGILVTFLPCWGGQMGLIGF